MNSKCICVSNCRKKCLMNAVFWTTKGKRQSSPSACHEKVGILGRSGEWSASCPGHPTQGQNPWYTQNSRTGTPTSQYKTFRRRQKSPAPARNRTLNILTLFTCGVSYTHAVTCYKLISKTSTLQGTNTSWMFSSVAGGQISTTTSSVPSVLMMKNSQSTKQMWWAYHLAAACLEWLLVKNHLESCRLVLYAQIRS